MKRFLTIVAAIALIMGIFLQNTVAMTRKYVTTTGAGSNTGADWANAYDGTQLQIAINSGAGQVWVAKGTYKPTTGTDRTISFQMVNSVAIYGGFAGTELTVDGRVTYGAGEVNETILSGDIGTVGDSTDNSYHVIYAWRLNSSAILDGFTITKGNANVGGGENYYGGGMYNYQGSPTINNCRFISNYGVNGGGVYGTSSSSTFNNCIFSSNSADGHGGGVYCYYSPTTFNNCTFSSNSVSTYGGAIAVYDGTPTIVNNCIFWGNTTGTYGNQIALQSNSTITLNYSCYSFGTGDIYIEGGCTFTATNNNITSDPLFVNAAGGNYKILGTSPCVDFGNDSYNTQTYDIRGSGYTRKLIKTSVAPGTIDMGAFEYKFGSDLLPVELTSFTANTNGKSIELKWNTATEVNNAGFEIEKRVIDNGQLIIDNWKKIGFVEGHGTTNAPQSYSYVDARLNDVVGQASAKGTVSYRLKQIDRDGKFEYSNTVEVKIGLTAEDFKLTQNFPNPFNPNTTITFAMKTAEHVNVTVYNALGQSVATLYNGIANPNELYSLNFDGKNLSSGTYFYALRSASRNEVKKMSLMK